MLKFLQTILIALLISANSFAETSEIIEVVTESPKDIFQITNNVTYADPPNFGYNMTKGFAPHSLRWLNMYSLRWGMEPNRFEKQIFLNDVSKCTKTRLSNGKPSSAGKVIAINRSIQAKSSKQVYTKTKMACTSKQKKNTSSVKRPGLSRCMMMF